ncbi:MAG TPA: iron transporter [Thermomicrobiales bacterium]|nr:iron transporter [Thermomicrobiales bacterium]
MQTDQSAQPQLPPMTPSQEGAAYGAALAAMNRPSGVQTRRAGDYEIALAVEQAEGLWFPDGGDVTWQEPGEANAHVEVAVRDAADGRFLPGLTISVTIAAADGTTVGTQDLPFLWHPWLYHYGRNWTLPASGDYEFRVRVAAPSFPRHDHKNGYRYARPVEASFRQHVDVGQKRS